MFAKQFLFGTGAAVDAQCLYTPEQGFGFVSEQNRRAQELLRYPELNSGFEPYYWYTGETITALQNDATGVYLDSDGIVADLDQQNGEKTPGEHRYIPLCFKADVPAPGNYRVTVTIQPDAGQNMGEVLLFTGRRRLAFKGKLPAGRRWQQSFIVNTCDIVPRGQTAVYPDTTLDITLIAAKPRLTAVKIEDCACPTLYIAGDSTVTDQSGEYPYAPGTTYCGWGQMLTAYLGGGIALSNHAHSGLTTETFRCEGHYAVIEKYIQPGDYCVFQFGHNDQKHPHLQANNGYPENLTRYVAEIRAKGALPLLITPIARNTWKGSDGGYNDLLRDHAAACVRLGQELNVPVLDLHAASMAFIQKTGCEGAKGYYFPGDYTHSDDYGGYLMAGFVAQEITRVCAAFPGYEALAGQITPGFGPWPVAAQIVPAIKPKRFENMASPCPTAELLAEIDNLGAPTDRAAMLDMVVKTAHFVPVNVYNDEYTDVAGHEWYAGAIESAYQNAIVQPEFVVNNCLQPQKAVTLEDFITTLLRAYQAHKAYPAPAPTPYDTRCHTYARPFVQAACALGLLPADGSADLNAVITRGRAVELCRQANL